MKPTLATVRQVAAQLEAAKAVRDAIGSRNAWGLKPEQKWELAADYAAARAEVLRLEVELDKAIHKHAGTIP